MIDYSSIIERYYDHATPLYDVLVVHSRQVAELAAQICERLIAQGVPVDADFVYEAAMLHDIGIVKTDADGIHCHGTEPYIKHGTLGRMMLDDMGLYRHALVCERHTGAGLSLNDIVSQNLPLPHRDLLPVSLEEKIVCYADKFFSKTHLGEAPKPMERVRQSMARFGEESLQRFNEMAQLFGEVSDYR